MKITKNEIVEITNTKYDEFDLQQFIVELDVGEKIEIFVNGKKEREYIAKYINCHMNAVFQDKGIKDKTNKVVIK